MRSRLVHLDSFRGYRFEPLVLVLVALAALPAVALAGPQDRTRYELTRHLVYQHTLTVEPKLFDRAEYGGKSYSDKAPGMSFLAVPAFQLERVAGIAKAPHQWHQKGDLSLWLMRILTSGVLFLVAAFVVGRLAEGVIAGTGAATAAVFGAATIAAPLAPTFFEYDAAGACAIVAFALVWRGRRPWALAAAGFAAGCAVLFQYAAALIAIVLLVWCARRGLREVGWLVLGGIPPALALGAYDWIAFGSPFHLSYRYVANVYAERQHHGFFGIGVPTLDGIRQVLVGNRGLLVFSPVLVAAAVGLWLLWRRGRRAPAVAAAAISVLFVLLDAGYFLPYGGGSPGPRFLGSSIPFLVLGLPAAFAAAPRLVSALALVSAAATAVDSTTWGIRPSTDTAWVPSRNYLAKTAWSWVIDNRNVGALLILLAALAAVSIGSAAVLRRAR